MDHQQPSQSAFISNPPSSPPPILHNNSLNSSPPCLDMNEMLWAFRRDPTTVPAIAVLFAFLYSLIVFVGIGGNCCVVLAIARTKSLKAIVSNVFILALSCSDIIVCAFSATFTPFTAFRKVWLFGPSLCSLIPFIAGTSLCFSSFTLVAISIDRFMLIRFPLHNQLKHSHAFIIILLISVLSAILSLPMLFTQKLLKMDGFCGEFCYEYWGQGPGEKLRQLYGTLLLTVQFILPLILITFCYTGISVRLTRNSISRHRSLSNSWNKNQPDRKQQSAKRRLQRTNRLFVLMVFAFMFSWIWTLLFNILRDFDLLPAAILEQEFLSGLVTHLIAMTSTVWNPILYALLNPQLRNAFINLLPESSLKWMLHKRMESSGENNNKSAAEDRSRHKLMASHVAPFSCQKSSIFHQKLTPKQSAEIRPNAMLLEAAMPMMVGGMMKAQIVGDIFL